MAGTRLSPYKSKPLQEIWISIQSFVHLCTGVEVLVKATKPEHDDQAESGEDITASQNIT